MPLFHYHARSSDGSAISGEIEAASADAAAVQIKNRGLIPVRIEPGKAGADGGKALELLQRRLQGGQPGLNELILFSRQMYTLTKAGIPLIQGMNRLAESTSSRGLREAVREITADLESGRDLAGAFARHPAIFNSLYISMIRVGEEAGRLEESFLRLYQYLEREKTTIKRIKSALRYPVIVLVAIAIAIGVLTVMVIPAFAKVFSSFQMELPWATRALLAVSEFASAHWMTILGLIFGLGIGAKYYVGTEPGRRLWDRLKLRIPVVGSIILRSTLARFARAFTMADRAGVPITQNLAAVARAADNVHLADKMQGMRSGIERGESLTRTAAHTGLFPPLVLQMMAIGEETGKMDDMMEEVADFYEREVDYDIDNLSAIIEPLMTVIMGILVLILALGIFLPMWDLTQIARR